jgi:hypothetical protein
MQMSACWAGQGQCKCSKCSSAAEPVGTQRGTLVIQQLYLLPLRLLLLLGYTSQHVCQLHPAACSATHCCSMMLGTFSTLSPTKLSASLSAAG